MPDIHSLQRLCQSLAMLDAILSPDWGNRYFSFNSSWGENTMLASLRNGSGDELFISFGEAGAIAKGFDHESPMSPHVNEELRVWPGVLEEVPGEFNDFLAEPAISIEDTTFCFWRLFSQNRWQTGKIEFPEGDAPDGSTFLLQMFDGRPETYVNWAKDYYERPVNLEAVSLIYNHRPLDADIVRLLNPDSSMEQLASDVKEIGYGN